MSKSELKPANFRILLSDLTSKIEVVSNTEFIREKIKIGEALRENQLKNQYPNYPALCRCDEKEDNTDSRPPVGNPYIPVFPEVKIGDPIIPGKRRVPEDVTETPGGVYERNQFISLDEIIENIRSDSREEKKLAIVITGGGARGAYEAGVIEAILKKIEAIGGVQPPKIVSGTSAGAIVATCTFVDLLYPKQITPNDLFHTEQAIVWRDIISKGNNASKTLFGDRAWIIEFATGKEAIPGISIFFDTIKNIEDSWGALSEDIKGVAAAGKELLDAFQSMDAAQLALKIKAVTDLINQDQSVIGSKMNAVWEAIGNFDLVPEFLDRTNPWDEFQAINRAINELIASIGTFLANLANRAFEVGTFTIDALIDYLKKIGEKLGNLAVMLAKVVGDAGNIVGNLVKLSGLIIALVLMVTTILAYAGHMIVGILLFWGGRKVLEKTNMIERSGSFDHILPNTGIMKILSNFIADASRRFYNSRASLARGQEQVKSLTQYWLQMRDNPMRPDIYLSSTNLSAQRSMTFAYANKDILAQLAADNFWIYDMAGQLNVCMKIDEKNYDPNKGYVTEDGIDKSVSSRYFRGSSKETREPLVKATMTSSTIPAVFEPQKWSAIRRSPHDVNETQVIDKHSFVDGGVINNSPLDIAVLAGANHIIMIELTPLYLYNDVPNICEDYNLISVIGSSFSASLTGSLQRQLSYIGAANEMKAEDDINKVNIYRIAPLIPETVQLFKKKNELDRFNIFKNEDCRETSNFSVSPGIINFDGLYNERREVVMSLYDWFVQGYIDAMGYSESQFIEDIKKQDKLIADYIQNGPRNGCRLSFILSGNKFWYMEKQPVPESADYNKAGVKIPGTFELVNRVTRSSTSNLEEIPKILNEAEIALLCPR